MQKIDFLKFYVINTSDNLPFQPYFCNPHVISFQKMYILSVVQFMLKTLLPPDCDNLHFDTKQKKTQNHILSKSISHQIL